jgi:hypothetical protein
MSSLVHAAILLIAMAASTLTQNTAEQPPSASVLVAATTPTQSSDAKPWIDLNLTGAALSAAMTKAHVTGMGQNGDRSVFYFVRTDNSPREYTAMSDANRNAFYLQGPAVVQLGNPKAIKTYTVNPTEGAICFLTSEYQDCVIALGPRFAENPTDHPPVNLADRSQADHSPDSSADRTYSVATIDGRDVRVSTYTHYNADCSPAGDPDIVLHNKPAHGVVSFRPQTTAVRHSRFGAVCIGKTLPGLAVWYTPDKGFSGADQFDYYIVSRQNVALDTAVVNVR